MMPKRADKRINLRKNRVNNQKMKMPKFKLTKVKRKNMRESLEKNRVRFQ